MSRSTIHDIAKALKITASTVSRALNGHPAISEVTRGAVLRMAQELNYEPNRIAAALRSGRTYTVGILTPYVDRPFFGAAIRGIEDELAKSGYGAILCQTHENPKDEQRAIETLLRLRVDGIIASMAKNAVHHGHYERVTEAGIPLVFFDNVAEQMPVSMVMIDDYQGAYEAVRHLIEQGCQRIAHFAGQQHLRIYRERLRGYLNAIADHNLQHDDRLILSCISDIEAGRQCAMQLFALPQPPDAIFSSSDYAALGALRHFKAIGIKVPEQMAIVGFANEPFTDFIEPGLSSVDQCSSEMGTLAARIFLEAIQHQDAFVPRKNILQPNLVIRKSSLRR
jgi:LacI family transcriptional regulator